LPPRCGAVYRPHGFGDGANSPFHHLETREMSASPHLSRFTVYAQFIGPGQCSRRVPNPAVIIQGDVEMSYMSKLLLGCSSAVLIQGCAATALNSEAQAVRVISDEESKKCRLLDSISTNNQHTLIGNPEEDARNRAKNRVAGLGGNALRIKSTDFRMSPSGVGGIFTLSGEAYRCK